MRGHATKNTGNLGEDIACIYLVRKGFKIRERNYRCVIGEIDIIAEKDSRMHIVEVKASSCVSFSMRDREYRPEEHVHHPKLYKLVRLAEMYVTQKKETKEYQIDVLGVLIDNKRRLARCRLFEQVL